MPRLWIYLEGRVLKSLIVLIFVSVLCACSSKAPKEDRVQDNYDYSASPSYYTPMSTNQEVESTPVPSTPSETVSSSTIDRYDEGLLDGEAAAEEDRLAGRPGMQIGGEDDDEDYDDGYDDGYDE